MRSVQLLPHPKAVEAVAILDKAFYRPNSWNRIFQNRRVGYRDIKYDHLGLSVSGRISKELKKRKIPHTLRRVEGRHSFHYQIRLAVSLSFSLGKTRKTLQRVGGNTGLDVAIASLPYTRSLEDQRRDGFNENKKMLRSLIAKLDYKKLKDRRLMQEFMSCRF